MHRELKALLPQASGASEFAIVVILDIRGFSAFSAAVESPSVAMYIKRVYQAILDRYFPNAGFFKPTGDGLLVIVPFSEKDFQKVAEETVASCLALVRDFPDLCRGDPMVNFETPKSLGIGVSRGPVSRLESGGKMLDYSGRFVNLAARLMDLARPAGVVIDRTFGADTFSPETLGHFESDEVFLPSVAELVPVGILYTKGLTVIPQRNKQPLADVKWKSVKQNTTLRRIQKHAKVSKLYFSGKPSNPSAIRAFLHYQRNIGGKATRGLVGHSVLPGVVYHDSDGRPGALVTRKDIVRILKRQSVKTPWSVQVEVRYPVT